MLAKLDRVWRRARFTISINHWLVRTLGLSVHAHRAGKHPQPGLLIIQIDGLSREQLENAMRYGSMPFMQRLIEKEGYHLSSMYSGLPSSTPSVQGELFYGVKCCEPAFSFERHQDKQTVVMVEPNVAARVEKKLISDGGQPLLEGGSSYSNLFTGGACESSFCAASTGWSSIMPTRSWFKMLLFVILKIPNIIRAILLGAVELGLALVDLVRGTIDGKDFIQELKFVPMRIAACVILREMVETGVSLDVTRGLPIVHANFIGYDEHSHRRGPSSRFAHWSLKGIDRALHRIWNTATRCPYRDYDVWIYSDHGQESTIPYSKLAGMSIHKRVQQAYQHISQPSPSNTEVDEKGLAQETKREAVRGGWIGWPGMDKLASKTERGQGVAYSQFKPKVVAMGPIGFVYLSELRKHKHADVGLLARQLAHQISKIDPGLLVAVPERNCEAGTPLMIFMGGEVYELPKHVDDIFGFDHPFLDELSEDFKVMVDHPDSGDLLLSGWSRSTNQPVSLRTENGSHAGPGYIETHAFALLPSDIKLQKNSNGYIRPLSLRKAALKFLGKDAELSTEVEETINRPVDEHKYLSPLPLTKSDENKHCLRVLTYNIHSCIGMDGHVSTARIARVISSYQPDVVCLQEVDVDFAKTDQVDQVKLIAAELSMDISFHPVRNLAKGRFGNAILTDLPMRKIHSELLSIPRPTKIPRKPFNEARGAVWAELEFKGVKVNIITTHLGLTPKERRTQVDELLSDNWLAHPECSGPTVLCGDFNASPTQQAAVRIGDVLENAHTTTEQIPKTFPSHFPRACLDHIFVDKSSSVKSVIVGKSSMAKLASDHLPLIADIEIVGVPK